MRQTRNGVFGRCGVTAPDHPDFGDQFPTSLDTIGKRGFFQRATGTEEVMGKTPSSSVGSDDVLQVENKWSYLHITPTYDQYVDRWVTMPDREGFHLKTRSPMKELFEDDKWMVLSGKRKKRTLFKIRVDVCRRSENLPEDRTRRAGLGDVRCPRVTYTDFLYWYAWSNAVTTDRQYDEWLRSRRARRQ